MRVPAPPEPSASQQPTVPSRHLWRLVGGYLVMGAGLAAVVSLWLPWIHFEAPTPAMLPDDLPPPKYVPPPFVPAVMLRASSAQVMALQLAPYALLLLCGLMQVITRGRLRVLALAVLGFPLSFLGLVVSVYYAYYALSNEVYATSGVGPPFPTILIPKYVGSYTDIGAYLSGGSFIVALIGCRIAAAG